MGMPLGEGRVVWRVQSSCSSQLLKTEKASCSSEEEWDPGAASSGQVEGRWRCSQARLGYKAAPSGCKTSIAHACITSTGIESSGVMHSLNCGTTEIAMIITDIDIRRKMVLLLSPCVVSTLKKKFGALGRCLLGDAFRNRH